MTCLCHEARLRFGKAMWAWLDDDRIPLRERWTVASKLLFGVDPSQTLDSSSIDLWPARPGSSQLLTGAFALQAVFQVGQVRTLQFQAQGYGAAHVIQVRLMVMCVERVKTIIGK